MRPMFCVTSFIPSIARPETTACQCTDVANCHSDQVAAAGGGWGLHQDVTSSCKCPLLATLLLGRCLYLFLLPVACYALPGASGHTLIFAELAAIERGMSRKTLL